MRHFKTDLLLIVAAFCLGTFVGMQRENPHLCSPACLEMGKQQATCWESGVTITTQHGR